MIIRLTKSIWMSVSTDNTTTVTNARMIKYIIGGIGWGACSDIIWVISASMPSEKRINIRCATTIPKGGQYVRDIQSARCIFPLLISFDYPIFPR